MKRVLHTARSFLDVGTYDNVPLARACVKATSDVVVRNPPTRVFNRPGVQHRSVGFFSDQVGEYAYSGCVMRAHPLCADLSMLMTSVNEQFHAAFNAILVNVYEGTDFIGTHSDDEKCLDPTAGVVSLTVGAMRTFRIRDKQSKAIVKDLWVPSQTLIQMGGAFQSEFKHEIPKVKKADLPVGTRWSFTFRKHKI